MKELADLDNEIVTPVDFIAMNKQSKTGGGGGNSGFKEYTHLEPDQVFFIPYQTATNLGGELRSIAIDFGDPKIVMDELKPLMHRLGLNLYAGQITHPEIDGPERGHIDRFSSIASTNSQGMELVFFPILIAVLIVLNTMLGSVFERVHEIHIFSSIGLAPSHIGMLFIAEALVYAILGRVAGYLLGQFTSKLLGLDGLAARPVPELLQHQRGNDDLDRRRRRSAVHDVPGAKSGGSGDARHGSQLESAGTGRRSLDRSPAVRGHGRSGVRL